MSPLLGIPNSERPAHVGLSHRPNRTRLVGFIPITTSGTGKINAKTSKAHPKKPGFLIRCFWNQKQGL